MRICCILIILHFLLSVHAQQTDPGNTLMMSLDYISNALSQDNINGDIKQPVFSPMAAFVSKSGFEAVASAVFTGNSDDSMKHYSAYYDFGVAYSFQPLKNLTLYSGYTHSFFGDNANHLMTLFNNDLQVNADYNLKKYTVGITGGYLWGKQQTYYALFRNHYQIAIDRFLSPWNILVIQPEIDFNFGSYGYLSKYYLNEVRQYNGLYFYLIWHSVELRRYLAREIIRNPGASVKELVDQFLEEQTDDSFNLSSISFCIPFTYSMGNWGINAGIYMILPLEQPNYLPDDTRIFINIGLSYTLDVGQKQKK